MKKFFKPKEAGAITPLPPTSPAAASSSSFGTPRPFDEYQARVAAQAEQHRPLSYQPALTKSRSRPPRGSADDAAFPQQYSPTHRHSQQLGRSEAMTLHRSPDRQRHSKQFHSVRGGQVPYDSYSDPNSHQPQHSSTRPSYDRSRGSGSDRDKRASQPIHYPARNSLQPKQRANGMPAFSPPGALRPAHQASRHALNHSPSAPADRQLDSARYSPSDYVPLEHSRTRRRTSDDDDEEQLDSDPDDRLSASRAASRAAAYPVYSGPDGDGDDGEVLISQGRYEETTLTELRDKDKTKSKKLFGFAAGGKDKKSKLDRDKERERDRSHASSPMHTSSRDRDRDRDDGRVLSPSFDAHLGASHERREGGWMDRWNKRAHQQQAARLQDKEAEEIAGSRVGWLAANAVHEHDWMHILPLIDVVSQSDAAAKEAARALRKEFKYAAVDAQRRAVRIWALLTLNASDRFRHQVATKRFLDAVEDSVSSSKTPLSVKETMLRVLGVLAFEFRSDPELAPITKCWNRVKPSDRPKDGEPLENELLEFRLPQHRTSAAPLPQLPGTAHTAHVVANDGWHAPAPPMPRTQAQQAQQQWPSSDVGSQPATEDIGGWAGGGGGGGTDVVSKLEALAAAATMEGRTASHAGSERSSCGTAHEVAVVAAEDDVRRLHEECQMARSNAAVLVETLVHEGLHGETAELVDEFYDKLVRSQELLASQIGWASAQADRSRARVAAGAETREEALLADLLEAHGRASEAVAMVDDARRRIDEEELERRVTERSRLEVGIDRTALVQDAHGDLYELDPSKRGTSGGGGGLLGVEVQASGSRSPSPNAGLMGQRAPGAGVVGGPRVSRPLPVPRSEPSCDSNSARSVLPAAQSHSHSRDASVSSHHTPPSTVRSGLPLLPRVGVAQAVEPPLPPRPARREDDEVQTPTMPSAKALGKRRAVSVRYPSPPPAQTLVNGIDNLRIRPQ